MDVATQVRIMETQLDNYGKLMDKMVYMYYMFDPDPEFTQEARDIVRSNVAKTIVTKR